MRRIEYVTRLLCTGLSFAFFGIGGLLLSLTAFPLMNLFVRDRARRAHYAQWLVQKAFRLHVLFMTAFGVIRVEVRGGDALASDTGTLVVANHPTLIDVVLLMSVMRRTQCIVKAQLWRNPFMRGVIAAAGYIRNDDQPEKLIDDCAAVLAEGNNLVVFPEGSRTVPGAPVKFQRGAANIALKARAPIRPVTISCEPPTLKKGQKWYEIPATRAVFTIAVGSLIEIDSFIEDANQSKAARRLNSRLSEVLVGGK
ncbi:lysophospholipid acyltransferase family protein [Parvibaculum sp.]|uniref:lysophospholipid acyltransferase family protein n=1 Tax=Parvibaculum sp. TaxID=2024848 RepID=UPI0025DCD14E|nr:lysophospholipid acyltransferase family protein [Parvibaculum sp.]